MNDLELARYLGPNAPAKKYRQRAMQEKNTVEEWGQRKLFLSELTLLTEYHNLNIREVVYAGAAPGTHVLFLMELFPHIKFVLIDPRSFDDKLVEKRGDKLELYRAYFTDDWARRWRGRDDVAFISDIRTGVWNRHGNEMSERMIWQDMLNQERWVEIMNPIIAMLKFRLPWAAGNTRYLGGAIQLQIWAPRSSTETRLVVRRGDPKTIYDNKKYEGQMFFFNSVARIGRYRRPKGCGDVDLVADHCYDCTAEVFEWMRFKRTFQISTPVLELANRLTEICNGEPNMLIMAPNKTYRNRAQRTY